MEIHVFTINNLFIYVLNVLNRKPTHKLISGYLIYLLNKIYQNYRYIR